MKTQTQIVYYQRTPDQVLHGFYALSTLNVLSNAKILECSAGNGDIADMFRLRSPHTEIDCIEINPLYCQILVQKGYVVYQDMSYVRT